MKKKKITHKVCRRCDDRKAVNKFRLRAVTPDGYDTWCADCRTERERNSHDAVEVKTCTTCHTEKQLFMFTRDTKAKDLRSNRCRDCAKDMQARYRIKRSPVDVERICVHLKQPREGISKIGLIDLWTSYTDFYLPRLEDRGKPLVSLITGQPE